MKLKDVRKVPEWVSPGSVTESIGSQLFFHFIFTLNSCGSGQKLCHSGVCHTDMGRGHKHILLLLTYSPLPQTPAFILHESIQESEETLKLKTQQ